jgi:plasmid replication initiation protein
MMATINANSDKENTLDLQIEKCKINSVIKANKNCSDLGGLKDKCETVKAAFKKVEEYKAASKVYQEYT